MSHRQSKLFGDVADGYGSGQILLHEQQCAAHPLVGDVLEQWRTRLRIVAVAGTIEQQYLVGLLSRRAPKVQLEDEGGQVGSPGPARAGDAIPIGNEQPIGNDFVIGKSSMKSW